MLTHNRIPWINTWPQAYKIYRLANIYKKKYKPKRGKASRSGIFYQQRYNKKALNVLFKMANSLVDGDPLKQYLLETIEQ